MTIRAPRHIRNLAGIPLRQWPQIRARRAMEIIRRRGGATIFEIAAGARMPMTSASARVRELALVGLIERTATRRRTGYGHTAIVWIARRGGAR